MLRDRINNYKSKTKELETELTSFLPKREEKKDLTLIKNITQDSYDEDKDYSFNKEQSPNNLPHLNIMADFFGDLPSAIEMIKSYPSLEDNFPNVLNYIKTKDNKYNSLIYSQLFNFEFFNIYSQMLFIHTRPRHYSCLENSENNYYEFIWVIDNDSFYNKNISEVEKLECMKVTVIEEKKEITCQISEIATDNFSIPILKMNNKIYTQSSVCVILALNLISQIRFNKCFITDGAYIEQIYDSKTKRIMLLNERIMTCNNSIYYKYGFILTKSGLNLPRNTLCDVTLQEIIDDYKIKVDYWDNFQAQILNREREEYKCKVNLAEIYSKARELFEILDLVENKNITIKEWLLSFDRKQRNYRVALLEILTDIYFNMALIHNGVIYAKGEFYQRYKDTLVNVFMNPDIKSNIKNIYKYGLPK